LTDHAPAIDPSRVKPRNLDDIRPGGLGTYFIRRVMDEVEFLRPASGSGNLLRMVRRID
jgi:sigma-B regulation protein RsbU (phosphoserine phosphatase)